MVNYISGLVFVVLGTLGMRMLLSILPLLHGPWRKAPEPCS